ncbi:ImmA/IrrE family metallo-endopeptidase [Amycolatopsis sp. NPDC059657]|uniref:ImmA/IrrE family metallo-endopeptidase n=1 Tax=Amycolatopsis sp. NPDC059657 TaxID=3346899 RepID=UPI00366D13B1
MKQTLTTTEMIELIAELQELAPNRPLSYGESLQVARLQAARLRELLNATEQPDIVLTWLIRQKHLPVHFVPSIKLDGGNGSGLTTNANDNKVQIYINESEPSVRQRFSLLHEFKHALDFKEFDTLSARLGSGNPERQRLQVELICNEFAAQALMPATMVKRVWSTMHDIEVTALFFNVSAEAMRTRLSRLGLIDRPATRTFLRSAGNLKQTACCI